MLEGLTPKPARVYTCKVAVLEQELSASDFQILVAALEDPQRWSARGLQTALRDRGVLLTDTVIARHRNKRCWCYLGKLD